MIADFPDIKIELKKLIDKALQQRIEQSAPLYSRVNKKTLYEGDKLGVLYPDGRHEISGLKVAQSQFTIKKDDIPTLKPSDLMN